MLSFIISGLVSDVVGVLGLIQAVPASALSNANWHFLHIFFLLEALTILLPCFLISC